MSGRGRSPLGRSRRGVPQAAAGRPDPRRNLALALACLPWLALLGWQAAAAWFLTDDAFISFRYVRNLLEGHGLVFNPGERVEGYSNFLWVLELAGIWRVLGVPPEAAAQWLSVLCTAGTLGAMGWWVLCLPALPHRRRVAWMMLGLVCSSATFAVWTSGGGLETRQFSCLVVLAVVCLSLHRDRPAGLLAASLSLVGAAYTRPEGLLMAAGCFSWFAVQHMGDRGWRGLDRTSLRALVCLVVPFVVMVGAHYLFRYAYYGEWLPNTYYAKHIRPWYGSGFRYLWAAALDTGLYLLLPLAWVALRERWRHHRDGTFGLVLLLIGTHMVYVLQIGGDHFEYRPLDFYWPLLALPAALAIGHLGSRIGGRWGPPLPIRPGQMQGGAQMVLFLLVLFYCSALQGALLWEGTAIQERILKLHIELDEENARWLLAAPGMPLLTAVSNDLRRLAAAQSVASPFVEHREFANLQLRTWKPYAHMARDVIPEDALMASGALGVYSYYLPDLKIIDIFGLTDATVARHPVTTPNHQRGMAHDRQPPPGYLAERGVNFTVYPAAFSASEALRRAEFAVQVGALWMPFDAPDPRWVRDRFAGRNLQAHMRYTRLVDTHPDQPDGNAVFHGNGFHIGERFLGHFEDGFADWVLEGDAITHYSQHEIYKGQQEIVGNIGLGFLTSYHPTEGDRPTGLAISPEFTARADQYLSFLIAGGNGDGVGVRLLAGNEEIAVWRGRNTERFSLIFHALADVAGRPLRLEMFDDETGGWGHIMLDHVLLTRHEHGLWGGWER